MKIEKQLFQAADKMRGAMDAGEYKHVALGLLFLRYVSVAFERKRAERGIRRPGRSGGVPGREHVLRA
jgi:type I restriction-modification system DNA methylase subunit